MSSPLSRPILRGLKDGEILLEARILAVADVAEAMTSYRPALGLDRALQEIRENCGRLYDPEVVEDCLRVFGKGFNWKC